MCEGLTFYRPFCSVECNREHGQMVCLPAEVATEPVCIMCGNPTRAYESEAVQRNLRTWWRKNHEPTGEPDE